MSAMPKANRITGMGLSSVPELESFIIHMRLGADDGHIPQAVRVCIPRYTDGVKVIDFLDEMFVMSNPIEDTVRIGEKIQTSVGQVSMAARGSAHAVQMKPIVAEITTTMAQLNMAYITTAMFHFVMADNAEFLGLDDPRLRADHNARTIAVSIADQAFGRAETALLSVLDQMRTAGIITAEQHDDWAHEMCFGRFKIDLMKYGYQDGWFF